MHLSLGFSPCPNDTFIFDALVNRKIDTKGFTFEVVLEDVETLNRWAIEGKLDITKLSYGVLPSVLGKYRVLNSGSALGKGVGPILIANPLRPPKGEPANGKFDGGETVIAVPGEHTTANLLFSLAYPMATNKVFLRYDEIEDYVLSGKGPGVIIHENRFTYEQKGLVKVADLGDYWEKQTSRPIPLGGIVIRRGLDAHTVQAIDQLIRESIQYAYTKYPELNEYIRKHSQEMEEEVMRKHIDLYVNPYSISLGNEGRDAVKKLLEVYQRLNPGSAFSIDDIFV